MNFDNRVLKLHTTAAAEQSFERVQNIMIQNGVVVITYGPEEDPDVYIRPVSLIKSIYTVRIDKSGMN